MEIKTTYIGINEFGVKGIWCGFKPEKIKILQEIQVLYADSGKILKHKDTGEENYSILLEHNDSEDNYDEIEERN